MMHIILTCVFISKLINKTHLSSVQALHDREKEKAAKIRTFQTQKALVKQKQQQLQKPPIIIVENPSPSQIKPIQNQVKMYNL